MKETLARLGELTAGIAHEFRNGLATIHGYSRLLDPEAQQLFERLAPHLGETAFLRWIYRDLASARGGLPL